MRAMLLGLAVPLAAIAVPAAPAQGQSIAGHGFAAGPGTQFEQFGAAPSLHRDSRRDHRGRHDRRRHRDRDEVVVLGGFGWNEGWALYNNRSFESDSYNDWWHDRPDRAYPRWMQANQNCDRLWWGGGAWRCGW